MNIPGMSRFGMGGPGTAAGQDASQVDTAEQVYISSLALLKMLKHGTLRVTNDARRTQARVGVMEYAWEHISRRADDRGCGRDGNERGQNINDCFSFF